MREVIHTDAAPAAIGTYSQAVRAGTTVYLSGQIPLDPASGELVQGDIRAEIERAFANLKAVCEAAGGSLAGLVKLSVYFPERVHFGEVKAVLSALLAEPNPARAAIGVAQLPRGARVEVDGVLVLD